MSDLIKKIKIKKQDGTFTDYIPIGAEAQNISTSDGDSVQLKLNKKPYYYNSVADMKVDTKLKAGDMAVTLGYYEPNDGGNGEYRIISGNYTDDGGSIHKLNNNLFAELIAKDEITPEMFGAYGDANHDDTQAIQKILTKYNSIKLRKKRYKITSTITCSNTVKIQGYAHRSVLYSVIDDGSPVLSFPGTQSHFILKDFWILFNQKNAIGIYAYNPYDSCVIDNVIFSEGFNTSIKCGTSEKISQTLLINNCLVYSPNIEMNVPIVDLTKCYETNFLNNKLFFNANQQSNAPCLRMTNVYDANIQGNSFCSSSYCGIEFVGDCHYNNIISNTYEMITGDCSIFLNGGGYDKIEATLIIEAMAYYSAPAKVKCDGVYQGTIIGMSIININNKSRRLIVLNPNDNTVTTSYGNAELTSQGGRLTNRQGFGLTYPNGNLRYSFFNNQSETADYGMVIQDQETSGFNKIILQKKSIDFEKNGYRIKLKSPDGNTTKYIGIDNNGDIQLYDNTN